MKKLLVVLLCAVMLLSAAASAELRLGDCAIVANCNETISLRSYPAKGAGVIARIPVYDTVNVLGTANNGFVAVEADGNYGYVLEEYLELYDDYRGGYVQPGKTERYNINLFLSNFSEQYMPVYNEFEMFDAFESDRDSFLLDFAFAHILHNRPDLVKYDAAGEGGGRIGSEDVDRIIWKYFKTELSELAQYRQYQSKYYLSPAECVDRAQGGFVSLYRVDALGDSRYAVRFDIYGADQAWDNDVCCLNSSEAARRYDKSGEGLAVIVVDGDGSCGTLTDRSTWRLERWVTV